MLIKSQYVKRSWSCDGCKTASFVETPAHRPIEETLKRIQDAHTEMSPNCRNVKAKLAMVKKPDGRIVRERSYLDNFAAPENRGHLHFYLFDPGPLDASELKNGPVIRIPLH